MLFSVYRWRRSTLLWGLATTVGTSHHQARASLHVNPEDGDHEALHNLVDHLRQLLVPVFVFLEPPGKHSKHLDTLKF